MKITNNDENRGNTVREAITQIRIEQARQQATLDFVQKVQQEASLRLETRIGAVEAHVGNLEVSVRELTARVAELPNAIMKEMAATKAAKSNWRIQAAIATGTLIGASITSASFWVARKTSQPFNAPRQTEEVAPVFRK